MKHTIIYVPGLGDKKPWLLWLQKVALSLWRRHGVRTEIIPMLWAEDVPLKPRFDKLLARIDELHRQGHYVSLVGTSAGASAAVTAFYQRQRQVVAVATICGKLQGDIPDAMKDINPCFAESLNMLARAVPKLSDSLRKRILTLYAARDAVVPPDQATLNGAAAVRLPLAGHNTTCAFILLFQSRKITDFIKSNTP